MAYIRAVPGKGVTEWSWDPWSSHNGGYPIIPTSVGIELGDSVGVSDYAVKGSDGGTVHQAHVPCFLGLKNFYGHIGLIERGALINKLSDSSGDYYVAPSLYSAFNINSIEGLIKAAKVLRTIPVAGNISLSSVCRNLAPPRLFASAAPAPI